MSLAELPNDDQDQSEDVPLLTSAPYQSVPGRRVLIGYDRTAMTEGVGEWEDRLMAVVRERNRPPAVFSHDRKQLVHVQRSGTGAVIAPVKIADLAYRIAQWSSWGELFVRKGCTVRVTSDHKFYRDLATHCLGAPEFDPEVFPPLDAVTQVPTFTAAGRLIVDPGYDAEGKIWFEPPPDFRLAPLPEKPTAEDVERARQFILDEMLGEFPFDTPGDRANAVAMILQPLARRMISSLTPLFFLAAPTAGTGKSTLAKLAGLPASGQLTYIKADPGVDDQLRKLITAAFAQGKPLMLIDNINREVGGGSFASILTGETWEDRPPHAQKLVTYANTVTWVATGNTPTFSRELFLRTVFINLDSKLEDPSTRQFARPMPQHAQEHRFEFLHACLVLIRHWVYRGRPQGGAFFGRYPEWAATMSGLLDSAGIEGFLTNVTSVDSLDTEGHSWRALVRLWLKRWSTGTVMLQDLYELIDRDPNLSVAFADVFGPSQSSRVRQAKLQKALKEQARRPFHGHLIEVGPNNDTDFLLVPAPSPTQTPTPEPKTPEPETPPTPAPTDIDRKARRDAEQLFPGLLAQLGDREEIRRLGNRLDADKEAAQKPPAGPGERLADKLAKVLLARGLKRYGLDGAWPYVQAVGLFSTERAEAEPTDVA